MVEIHITEEDRALASELMLAQRQRDNRVSKSDRFTFKDANPVLADIARGVIAPKTLGLVNELFHCGASVCIKRPKSKNVLKVILGTDQVEDRSEMLLVAAAHCGEEVFQVLVGYADLVAVDQALPVAISCNSPNKVSMLLRAGARAFQWCCVQFPSIIESGTDGMVLALLPASNGVCQVCRNRGLVRASALGYAGKVTALLEGGADATFGTGAALREAARSGREDIIAAITSRAQPKPTNGLLDAVLAEAYANSQYRAVELCLAAGAKGPATDATLVEAVKHGQMELVEWFTQYGASVNYEDGTAVVYAVRSTNPELLRKVLCGQPSSTVMATALIEATKLADAHAAYNMTDILQQGGVDISHHGGQALALAAARGSVDILSLLLLQQRPSVESLNAALWSAMGLAEPSVQYQIVSIVLEAGASGPILDDALERSAGGGASSIGTTSLLLRHSSVDSKGGKPLVAAIKTRCIDQMRALMATKPSRKSLALAWREIDDIDDNDSFQADAYRLLLETGDVAMSLLDHSLALVAAKGTRGHIACRLLLQNSASPESLAGAAAAAAAKNLDLDMLQILEQHTSSAKFYQAAFAGALSEGTQWLSPRGLEVLGFLLQHGASGPEADAAFCMATQHGNLEATELLASSVGPETPNKALWGMVQHSSDWRLPSDSNIGLVSLLLDHGASGDAVNAALIGAVAACASDNTSDTLVDTLLFVGRADVNFQYGESLKLAIRAGNKPLLETLVASGACKEALSQAVAEAISCPLEEGLALDMIDVLVARHGTSEAPDFSFRFGNDWPLVIACLDAHPNSPKLVSRLLELGCDPDSPFTAELYRDSNEQRGSETATALAWALSQHGDHAVSSATIEALINGNASLHYIAPRSKATPLILAAKYHRGDIVKKLAKSKVTLSTRDCFGRSSLFYASRAGDLAAVNALIDAKALTDDGSLHEAARCLHSEVATALIKGKHDPSFPSTRDRHDGRTPLQELALLCDGSRNAAELEATILALVNGKANALTPWRGRNALFLALDNANPLPITEAIIDRAMRRQINDTENVFQHRDVQTGATYFLSATLFVEWGHSKAHHTLTQRLVRLLRDKGCVDRFYSPLGAVQPKGALGLPDKIQEAEDKRRETDEKRRVKEYDFQLKLDQERRQSQLKDTIDWSRHGAYMYQEQSKAQQKQEQSLTHHQQQLYQKAQSAGQELQQKAVAGHQQQAILMHKNEIAAAALRQESMQRLHSEVQMQGVKTEAEKRKMLQKVKMDNETIRFKKQLAGIEARQHRMRMQEQQAKERNMALKLRK